MKSNVLSFQPQNLEDHYISIIIHYIFIEINFSEKKIATTERCVICCQKSELHGKTIGKGTSASNRKKKCVSLPRRTTPSQMQSFFSISSLSRNPINKLIFKKIYLFLFFLFFIFLLTQYCKSKKWLANFFLTLWTRCLRNNPECYFLHDFLPLNSEKNKKQ